ncbi:MAG: phosphoribosylaminoimidazolecarboxamide formyltransferase [Gammaproteobacteria bacterium]|nr:phosphoribosylaminoimidazolecarboxamide formyltransferase [Gammaproteobacteria bacterium]
MPALKYGCNPHQAQAAFESDAVRVRNGAPSMINMLDALNAWQLVTELGEALDAPAAASFKHVSPAGAAVGVPLTDDLRRVYEVGDRDLSPLATAYVRARGADPKSSFGDFVALSHPVDAATAAYLKAVVSDGVVAPGFEEGTLATLAAKKDGAFVVIEADPHYRPPAVESREVFGVTLTQERNNRRLRPDDLSDLVCGELNDTAKRDLLLALVTLKYTQSNSVGYALDGQMIGIGAGQQSRVDCTKLAGAKADVWHLARHPKVLGIAFRPGVRRQERINWRVRYIEGDLTPGERSEFSQAVVDEPPEPLLPDERAGWLADFNGVALASDGFIPFRDNIDHAARHGVSFIAQPGGSTRDAEVAEACREHGIAMVHTGLRLFHH